MQIHTQTKFYIKLFLGGVICVLSFFFGSPVQATSSISIAVPATTDITIIPTDTSNANIGVSNLTITTQETEGFRVILSNEDTNLKSGRGVTIPSIASPTKAADMPVNTWGIYFGGNKPDKNSVFSPAPNTPTEFVHNELANASGTYKLAFAVKANTDLPAGMYQSEIIISVVADAPTITSLADATYMQDVTPEICANSELEEGHQLIDNRDGRKYWVARLKDGNCWMQQNLDLELAVDSDGNAVAIGVDGSKTILTDKNTNLSVDTWSTSDTTRLTPTNTLAVAPSVSYKNNNGAYSWDAGNIILTNPTGSNVCPNGSGADGYTTLDAGKKLSTLYNPGVCSVYFGIVKAGMNDTYTATTTSSVSGDSYDAHYLIGNWYTYGASTAGTAKGISSGIAQDSICAKGWKLPTDIEQATLLTSYGANSTANNGLIKIATKPLYFVRSGNPDANYGGLRSAGYGAYYWSNSAATSTDAYFIQSNVLKINPQATSARYLGFAVRCVAE